MFRRRRAAVSFGPVTTNGAQPVVGTNGTDVLPVGFCASLLHVVVDTAFVSSTAAGLAMTVGDTGSATRYLAVTTTFAVSVL